MNKVVTTAPTEYWGKTVYAKVDLKDENANVTLSIAGWVNNYVADNNSSTWRATQDFAWLVYSRSEQRERNPSNNAGWHIVTYLKASFIYWSWPGTSRVYVYAAEMNYDIFDDTNKNIRWGHDVVNIDEHGNYKMTRYIYIDYWYGGTHWVPGTI